MCTSRHVSHSLCCRRDNGGKRTNVWLASDVEAKRKVILEATRSGGLDDTNNPQSIATQRHGISGLPFVTKPPDAKTGMGGNGHSLVGPGDLSRPELSLMYNLDLHSDALDDAVRTGGVSSLLKRLTQKDLPGAGALCSMRVLTLLEPTGLVGTGVLTPYLTGGNGSKKALIFICAMLGLDPTCIHVHKVLEGLHDRLLHLLHRSGRQAATVRHQNHPE